ncbi:WD40-repeat-containing domain protein [Lipomyces oligophaga]|uniref:WD40-repeat-containing domain protein n=1 Tax=Lipomyces oligophaga TaxID=45792 RepID=UPI0034CE8786
MPMRLEPLEPENASATDTLFNRSDLADQVGGSNRLSLKNGSNGSRPNGSIAVLNDVSKDEDYHGVSKLETTRLIIQALHEMGYSSAAAVLETESACSINSPEVSAFKAAVLDAQWTEAERLLGALELKPTADVVSLKFLIRQQKYLEALEQRDLAGALSILHNELTVLKYDVSRLHLLSSLIMCTSSADVRGQANWLGVQGGSRLALFDQLQKRISPAIMIPPHRLATLLNHATDYEVLKCTYHNVDGPISLYTDHKCARWELPTVPAKVLDDHTGEVWFVTFSNDGTKLASASKDFSVIIWDLTRYKQMLALRGHADGVTAVAWSPDDSTIITCGYDRLVKLWHAKNGQCMLSLSFDDAVTSCAWLGSGDSFIIGSLDMERAITHWSIDGRLLQHMTGVRIYDLTLTPDNSRIIAISNEKRLSIYSYTEWKLIAEFVLSGKMTCVTTSKDSKYALVNSCNKELHLWDLEQLQLVRKCLGHQQVDFVIRSCFGGVNDNFLVSGSEDSNIYIWKRDDGSLIEVLGGHTKGVNSVAWNPIDKHMFASASDDNTIRIWTSGRNL